MGGPKTTLIEVPSRGMAEPLPKAPNEPKTRQGTTGKWILTADGGTPLLLFRWDLFGTESLTMVTPDHFRGQKRNGRFIDMRRSDDTRKPAPEPK